MNKERYDKELLKGIYPLLILKLLWDKSPMYGYQIEKNVRILSESNFTITEGSLYPILHKLEEKGLIKSKHRNVKNRVRKYYYITPQGEFEYGRKTAEVLNIYDELKKFLGQSTLSSE